MIFTAISDLHLSDKKPRFRKDSNYLETCYQKLVSILDHAVKYSDALVIGGDVFDYPTVPRYVVTEVQNILSRYNIRIFVIPGQHDLRYHAKGIKNTPLGNIVSNVFDFPKMAWEETKELARKEAQEKIDAFVDSFDQKEGEKTDFKIIVKKVIADTKPNESVKNIINEIIEEVS